MTRSEKVAAASFDQFCLPNISDHNVKKHIDVLFYMMITLPEVDSFARLQVEGASILPFRKENASSMRRASTDGNCI